MATSDRIILGIAILGAVLGIINTTFNIWSYIHKERPKLRVTSLIHNRAGLTSDYTGMQLSIRASNDSDFKVNILEYGLFQRKPFQKNNTSLYKSDFEHQYAGLVRTIEAHSVENFWVSSELDIISKLLDSNFSYIILDDGKKIIGKNPDLANQYAAALERTTK